MSSLGNEDTKNYWRDSSTQFHTLIKMKKNIWHNPKTKVSKNASTKFRTPSSYRTRSTNQKRPPVSHDESDASDWSSKTTWQAISGWQTLAWVTIRVTCTSRCHGISSYVTNSVQFRRQWRRCCNSVAAANGWAWSLLSGQVDASSVWLSRQSWISLREFLSCNRNHRTSNQIQWLLIKSNDF